MRDLLQREHLEYQEKTVRFQKQLAEIMKFHCIWQRSKTFNDSIELAMKQTVNSRERLNHFNVKRSMAETALDIISR